MKTDTEPLSKGQILKILYPEYTKFVDEIMVEKEKEIKQEYEKGTNAGEDQWAAYRSLAEHFRSLDL